MSSLAKRVGGRICVDASGGSAPPIHVGPYRLCFELASGGMATVYLAYEEAPGTAPRFAAVKLVHPHLANDAAFTEMFRDEAEIASRIRHPNVCAVYDFDVSEGGSYIAMEYLLGESMAALWRRLARTGREDGARDAPRDAPFVCKALADACEGLHAAHELTDSAGEPLEIVHRDVSPGNIVLTFDGITKVLDFGVAAAARKRHRTQTGMLKGKLAYIAPECLRGQRADRRSDVWAIGAVAWELVTGQRLFRRASDVDTLRAVMDGPVRAPSELRPGLPKELDDVLMLALQRDPDDRYETARDLGRDLARVATQGEVVTSSDLAEWLQRSIPGARGQKEQLLELAAQMARDEAAPRSERTSPAMRTSPAARPAAIAQEREQTHVYEREPSASARPAQPASEPPRDSRVWLSMIALGAVVGLASGAAATLAIDRARDGHPSPLESAAQAQERAPVTAPHAAAPPPAEPEARPELRLGAGSGLARGPYVLELVESDANELLLRVRLDPSFEPPATSGSTPAEAPSRRLPRGRVADVR